MCPVRFALIAAFSRATTTPSDQAATDDPVPRRLRILRASAFLFPETGKNAEGQTTSLPIRDPSLCHWNLE